MDFASELEHGHGSGEVMDNSNGIDIERVRRILKLESDIDLLKSDREEFENEIDRIKGNICIIDRKIPLLLEAIDQEKRLLYEELLMYYGPLSGRIFEVSGDPKIPTLKLPKRIPLTKSIVSFLSSDRDKVWALREIQDRYRRVKRATLSSTLSILSSTGRIINLSRGRWKALPSGIQRIIRDREGFVEFIEECFEDSKFGESQRISSVMITINQSGFNSKLINSYDATVQALKNHGVNKGILGNLFDVFCEWRGCLGKSNYAVELSVDGVDRYILSSRAPAKGYAIDLEGDSRLFRIDRVEPNSGNGGSSEYKVDVTAIQSPRLR